MTIKRNPMTELEYLTNRTNDITRNLIILNKEGEILNNDDVNMAIASLIKSDNVVKVGNGVEYAKIKKANGLINEIGGSYFHMMYGNILNSDLKENYAIRFLLLCTHLDYENNLVVGNTNSRRLMKESDLESILKLSPRETLNTKNYLIKNNLITIKDEVIKVNKDFAIKGKVKNKSKLDYSRVFEEGFKDLYYGVSPSQHKNLFFFIKCLPYLNNDFNILCNNPLERNKNLIKPLSFGELGKIFGMDRKQASKLKTNLFKLKIRDKKVIAELVNLSERRIVVNPAIFYKSNSECISDVAKIFETL
ncbi:hypothetical protein ACV3S3_11715 [Clostridium perfringens]